MKYKHLGKCGVNVSELCLGTMFFGSQVNEATSIELIKKAYDQGINFVDTANVYVQGKSEEIVGKAIKGMRDDIVLATKVRHRMGEGPNDEGLSRKHILKAVEDSLKRLDTDYIDIYYVHRPSNARDFRTGILSPPIPLKETLSALTDLVRTGKVRYIGCSNFPAWHLCEALWTSDKYDLENFVVVQPPYNILQREIEREIIPLCVDQGIGIVSYSPLAGGILTGKYKLGSPPPIGSRGEINPMFFKRPGLKWEDAESQKIMKGLKDLSKELNISMAQLALAWLKAQPALTAPIIAASNMKQLEENLAVTTINLRKEDLEHINELVPLLGPYIT
ncbi:MAG: Aldo/keto reductase [Thermoproteota archaeon]|nr:Aldo/keto reductase [Thermoproteota archaeon]